MLVAVGLEDVTTLARVGEVIRISDGELVEWTLVSMLVGFSVNRLSCEDQLGGAVIMDVGIGTGKDGDSVCR